MMPRTSRRHANSTSAVSRHYHNDDYADDDAVAALK